MTQGSCSLTKSIDNMANAIESNTVDNLVRDSEIIRLKDKARKFEYNIDEKATKAKLV